MDKVVGPNVLLPHEVAVITNPAENYASYRQKYCENPTIPFLVPHLREFEQRGEPAIQPLLKYLENQHGPPNRHSFLGLGEKFD